MQSTLSKRNQCNSIDPSPIVWKKGHLGVSENWYWVAISECVSDVLSKVTESFFEDGWPSELLVDNGRTFRSNEFVQNDFSPSDQKYTYARKLVESNDNPDASTDNMLNGQSVYVKPAKCKCTTPWNVGTVTGMDESRNIVEVNQVPYHQSHVRPLNSAEEISESSYERDQNQTRHEG
ncbi:hypothetical protein GJ496_004416 [Pomphorhynchus laevis]|nr:hypothetical protein GJ496_004416 [Pomphorhynchus laevis]